MINATIIPRGDGEWDVRIDGYWVRTCKTKDSVLGVVLEELDRADQG